MTFLHSAAGALGRGSFNVVVNAGAVYSASYLLTSKDYINDQVTLIVAIDTAFRIAITHVLDALKIPFLEKGTGRLLFSCLTLLTQPLSIKVAQKLFNASTYWNKNQSRIEVFGYIALGWKANMMIKDVLYLTDLKIGK